MCGTLYPTIGFVDSCDTAATVGFGVAPNTQILDPAQQSTTGANAYTFFQGQTVTLYIPHNQPTVLADELLRISVFNPATTTSLQLTSTSSGYNMSGAGASATFASSGGGGGGGGGCSGGLSSCATASSAAGTVGFSITSQWGLGAGLAFYVSPGLSCSTSPCSGATPKCVNGGGITCSGGTNSFGQSASGGITATANATITVLPSSLFVTSVFDTFQGQPASALPGGVAAPPAGNTIWAAFATVGGSAAASVSGSLYYTNVGTNCGGCCQTINGLSVRTWNTFTYPGLVSRLGVNTMANGGAINITIPANIYLVNSPNTAFGGFCNAMPPAGASWLVGVTTGIFTNYSAPFLIVVPPPTPSQTPSPGSSPSTTPTQTPTPTKSNGATASPSSTASLSGSPTATTTPSATPTISDTSRPSVSTPPDYGAIAREQQAKLIPAVAGAVGGLLVLVCAGGCMYVIRQRRLRVEARERMKASSRRFMGSQSNAYGNAHQDGAVHIGAARADPNMRPAVVVVDTSRSLSGKRGPARSNSMSGRR